MPETKKYVLFSPVSGTDPASDDGDVYRDGPMLHIVRKYQPQTVYLYLTDYFQPYEESDRRYSEMVKFVSADSAVEVIPSDKGIDVHRFDVFDQPFREILTRIHRQNQNAELLLNLSSGTPEMQSALYLVAATLPFASKPIQVDSPSHGPNYRRGKPREFDLDLVKEYLDETEQRCHDVTCQNARRTILKENIEKLVDSFDYAAALELYPGNEQLFGPKTGKLLKAAAAHLAIDEAGLQNSGAYDRRFYEQPDKIANSQERQCYDYILYLDTLLSRRAYSDFCRALSPAITKVMKFWLKSTGHDFLRFCTGDADNEKVSAERIQQLEPTFYAEKVRGIDYWNSKDLSAGHMLEYIRWLSYSEKSGIYRQDFNNFSGLRNAERNIRNIAAHQMVRINNSDIKSATSHSGEELLRLLRQEYEVALGTGTLRWDGLKRLNEQIKRELSLMP